MSRTLHVPFHDGVISQFEGYGDLAELDWDGYREQYGDICRLDRILEAEGDTVNRYAPPSRPSAGWATGWTRTRGGAPSTTTCAAPATAPP